ncbi:hypothetical protein APED_23640 [Acanthopleuribacter pedis]
MGFCVTIIWFWAIIFARIVNQKPVIPNKIRVKVTNLEVENQFYHWLASVFLNFRPT